MPQRDKMESARRLDWLSQTPSDLMTAMIPSRLAHLALIAIMALLAIPHLAAGQSADEPADEATFETLAAGTLAKHCVACHHSSDPRGGLDLTRASGLQAGGDSGPALNNDPNDLGLIWERVESGEMPPEDVEHRLSNDEVQSLRSWLEAGAPWPKERVLSEFEVTTDSRAGWDWWALQPLVAQSTPHPQTPGDHRYDGWIRAKLEQEGITPSPQASRDQLLRRLFFDLLGLPPSPRDLDTFRSDHRPDAWQRQVDRRLASPRFGERWGRHWLDVARYGDTHGYERDFPRANAWRYRDFVITAMNQDQPYDEFIRWQVAGDQLAPEDPRAIIASAFLASGPYDVTGLDETPSPILKRQARADELDEIITTTITSTLGLTVHCARCHNHKFDPVPQKDYYELAAIFAGVRRGDRPTLPATQLEERERRVAELRSQLREVRARHDRLAKNIDLSDLISGGDGSGNGPEVGGIDPRTGAATREKVPMLEEVQVNRPVRATSRYVDTVLIPDGGAAQDGNVVISSTGLQAKLPDTSGLSWDYIQRGPMHSLAESIRSDVNWAEEPHHMIGVHANKLITFDLAALRERHGFTACRLTGIAAYGGGQTTTRASVLILVDGQTRFEHLQLTKPNGAIPFTVDIEPDARFLTLVATDGGDGLGFDQVFFGDPQLTPRSGDAFDQEQHEQEIALLKQQAEKLDRQLDSIGEPEQVFGIRSIDPEPMRVHLRGNPETPGADVGPALLSCLANETTPSLGNDTGDGERRVALARWLTSPDNPLFARVIANRVWHYHFGQGIVATPSDFGFYGASPTHPELLDQLALDLQTNDWSLKRLHRAIVCSSTYCQSAQSRTQPQGVDAQNRWLWRFAPRRLEAEAIRDSILQVAGTLNPKMGGPGFRDFEFEERYAPIYRHITADRPEFWRRSVYRFSVRSVPNVLMEVLDCPNPSTTAPKRSETTTALQALSMLNDDFVLIQSEKMAERLRHESAESPAEQIRRAFSLAFGRNPSVEEQQAAMRLVESHGLPVFCRALLNANEFVYLE